MNLASIVIVTWLTIHQINAQGKAKTYYPDAKRYSEANNCNEKLMLPLTSLLFPIYTDWGYMCGVNYFDTCRAEFSSRCSETNCSLAVDEYMRWVDAMTISGSKYTCLVGKNRATKAMENGGYRCLTTLPGSDVFRRIITLNRYIWSPAAPITCSGMEELIKFIYPPLVECDAIELLKLIDGYFRAVVNTSPCAKQIAFNSKFSSSHQLTSSIAIVTFASVISYLL